MAHLYPTPDFSWPQNLKNHVQELAVRKFISQAYCDRLFETTISQQSFKVCNAKTFHPEQSGKTL
jgi:hypothetical protein